MKYGSYSVRSIFDFQIFYQHQKLNITLDQSIEDMVIRYTNYVKSLVDLGYPIRIVSITPTQANPIPHHNDPLRHLTMLNPVRGEGITLKHRIYMTEELNKRLCSKCFELDIGFVDLYDYLVDPNTKSIKINMTRDNGMHGYYIDDG